MIPLIHPRPTVKLLTHCTLLFLITAWLIWPAFQAEYTHAWHSIEATSITDTRFLAAHWPNPGWQPLWYCGVQTDYIYPPALRYGAATLTRLSRLSPARAYHIYSALLACLATVGFYLLAYTGARSMTVAFLCALATALVSPSFLLLPEYRHDAPYWLPQRFWVLMQYGEGPHMSALACLGFALAFSWRYLESGRALYLALASLCAALVTSHNFYGATGLAVIFPFLVWSYYLGRPARSALWRGALIAICAYALCAWWLTPAYIRLTLDDLRWVSAPGNVWSRWLAFILFIAYLIFTYRRFHGRAAAAWPLFVTSGALAYAVLIFGQRWIEFRLLGEPSRLIPELDLMLILCAAEAARRLWRTGVATPYPKLIRTLIVALVLLGLASSLRWIRHRNQFWANDANWRQRIEYRVPAWLAEHLPGSRVFASGSVRFWLDVWHDIPQIGGGSDQGLMNPIVMQAQWQVNTSDDAITSTHWLQVLGVDAIIVHGPRSQEHYHDPVYPEKYRGLLPVLQDFGTDDVIYRVPRRFPGLARVVWDREFDQLPVITEQNQKQALALHAAALEQGPAVEASTQWLGPDHLRIRTSLAPGQSIVVLETFDPSWRALRKSGEAVPLERDVNGFMRLRPGPGEHDIELRFFTPSARRIGAVLTATAVLLLVAAAGKDQCRRRVH